MNLHDAVTHLTPEHWERASRQLIRKALAEFSHERLLIPQAQAGGDYVVSSDDGVVRYRFAARLMALDHWMVREDSIIRWHRDRGELTLDAVEFVVELRGALGLTDEVLPVYLEEINSTLAATAYRLTAPSLHATELAAADFQTIEAGMSEGHPCFVANSGRLGFGVHEYRHYAPEAATALRLVWLAAHRRHCAFTGGAGIDHDQLMREELGDEQLTRFRATLCGLGLDPDDYHLVPVHPWQWWNKLAVSFAGEIAQRRLVLLGEGGDQYRAQQSIRTFYNLSDPSKHYVKTALSVLNMGFMRGLSAAYMRATPAINDWLAELVAGDDVLRRTGVSIARERAAVGYHHRGYEAATDRGSPYRKMLAALWRESPVPSLAPGQRLATMASLLHLDREGRSFAGALITRSGLDAREWLRRYLGAYLTPLLHSFYAYGLVFMPHGENVILVLEDGVVQRVVLKDIAEEIAVLDPGTVLPPDVERIRASVPQQMRLLSLFTDVFDCFLRFLNGILAGQGILDEHEFWSTVAGCVRDYQAATPALAERFRRHDLFAPTFALSCLNRLQLRNNEQMVDLQDPAGNLQLVGSLDNPIVPFRTATGQGARGRMPSPTGPAAGPTTTR